MRSAAFVLLPLLLCACRGDPITLPPPRAGCVVEHVSDGDTIRVSGCPETVVRLLLVDAPEIGHGNVAAGGNAAECFGEESAAYVRGRLPAGTVVTLQAGVRDTDQFGRALRYVFLGEELLNETIVREGFATRFRGAEDRTFEARVARAEDEARSARRGLWAACPLP